MFRCSNVTSHYFSPLYSPRSDAEKDIGEEQKKREKSKTITLAYQSQTPTTMSDMAFGFTLSTKDQTSVETDDLQAYRFTKDDYCQ